MKKHFTSHLIRKMQTETMRHQCTGLRMAKIQMPSWMWNSRKSHSLLVRMQTVVILKDSLAVSHKTKHSWLGNVSQWLSTSFVYVGFGVQSMIPSKKNLPPIPSKKPIHTLILRLNNCSSCLPEVHKNLC